MKILVIILCMLLMGCAATWHPERDLECTIRSELRQQNIRWEGKHTEFTASAMAILDWYQCMTCDE